MNAAGYQIFFVFYTEYMQKEKSHMIHQIQLISPGGQINTTNRMRNKHNES